MPALITPFAADGGIDSDAFQALVEWQIQCGSRGLVPVGTTGETPTLTHAEHKRVVELTVEAAAGRVPVIAGAGSNDTAAALEFADHAARVGAAAALIVVPYYNKPTQEMLYRHFKTIHDSVDIPIVVYNVPARTVTDITVETMARLALLPRIIGIKDASNDLARPLRMRTEVGADFCQLSGEDATAMGFAAQGGVGCISVTANVAPALCAQQWAAWEAGDLPTMAATRDKLGPLHRALFLESSPGPVKYAASLLGKASATVRPPLYEIEEATKRAVEAAMAHAGLI